MVQERNPDIFFIYIFFLLTEYVSQERNKLNTLSLSQTFIVS
jgi:hypothetical protein